MTFIKLQVLQLSSTVNRFFLALPSSSSLIRRLQFMDATLSLLPVILLRSSVPWSWVILSYVLMAPSIAAVIFYAVNVDFDGAKLSVRVQPQNVPVQVTEKALGTGAAGLFLRFLPAFLGDDSTKKAIHDWLEESENDHDGHVTEKKEGEASDE